MRPSSWFGFFASLSLASVGCSGRERPPPLDLDGGGSPGAVDGGGGEECEKPPAIDTTGLCQNEVVPVFQEKPTLYFVVDTSGSMTEPISIGGPTKMGATKEALVDVAAALGHRIRYGLAAFPGEDQDDLPEGCGAGREMFETEEGDPIVCLNREPEGPVLDAFTETVIDLEAAGGTSLSPTLVELSPTLLGLSGETVVILMTDGAPNCNVDARCGPEACMLNIEGYAVNGIPCDDDYNCCDPDLEDETGIVDAGGHCIDRDGSVDAIAELQDGGIDTYVVGVPGSELYADVMNELAEAGGTRRDGDVGYYDVKDLDELTETLRNIGSALAQSCELDLIEVPAFPDLFNVYFDAELVVSDPEDGWTLDGARVSLHGSACERVRSGDVNEVQMVSGCRTIVR